MAGRSRLLRFKTQEKSGGYPRQLGSGNYSPRMGGGWVKQWDPWQRGINSRGRQTKGTEMPEKNAQKANLPHPRGGDKARKTEETQGLKTKGQQRSTLGGVQGSPKRMNRPCFLGNRRTTRQVFKKERGRFGKIRGEKCHHGRFDSLKKESKSDLLSAQKGKTKRESTKRVSKKKRGTARKRTPTKMGRKTDQDK